MIAKTRRLNKPLSVVLMFALVLSALCFGVPPKVANAAYINYLQEYDSDNNELYYYIKNVKSGKYLTVQGGSFTSNANIVQWHFTGDNNQKWRPHFYGNSGSYAGCYKFSAYNTNYVIAMPDTSGQLGQQAKLIYNSTIGDQLKYLLISADLGNAAHRFKTAASGYTYALVANNAAIYDNTSIVHGTTGVEWSDQWLIEPVGSYNRELGATYAEKNRNHRLATYPDLDFYAEGNHVTTESVNYVSQCMAAGGKNYYRPSNQNLNYWWYVNKKEHIQNHTFENYADLCNYWHVTNAWYDQNAFSNKWITSYSDSCTNSLNQVLNPTDYTFADSVNFDDGDLIIFYKDDGGIENWLLATYVTKKYSNNKNHMKYAKIAFHLQGTNYNDTSLYNVIINVLPVHFYNDLDNIRIRRIHIPD